MNDLDLKDLWQSDPDNASLSLDSTQAQEKAHAFERKIKRRNQIEWIACLVVVLLHLRDLLNAENVFLVLGNGIIVLGGIYIASVLWRKGRVSLDADPALDTVAFIHEHANALDAQAKLLSRVPAWYLSPIALGLGLIFTGRFPSHAQALTPWLLTVAVVIVIFVGVAWYNLRTAHRLSTDAQALRASIEGI